MSEIIIKVDLEGAGENLKSVIGDLETFKQLLIDIKANKNALASAETIANVQKLTAELKKAELQIGQLQQKAVQNREKENAKLKEQSGIIGGLIAKKKELGKELFSAKTVEDVRRINSELAKTNLEIVKLKNTGVSSFNTFEKALSSFQFKFNFLGNLFSSIASGPMSLLTGAIQGVVGGLVELVTQSEKTARITEELNKLEEDQIENKKELAGLLKDINAEIEKQNNSRDVSTGLISEEAKNEIELRDAQFDAIQKANDDFKTAQEERLKAARDGGEKYSRFIINGEEKIHTTRERLNEDLLRIEEVRLAAIINANAAFNLGIATLQAERAANEKTEADKEFDAKIERLKKEQDASRKQDEDDIKAAEELADKLRKISDDAVKKLNEAQQERDKKNQLERLKTLEELGKSELELKILKLTKERDELLKNDTFTSEERIKIEQDFQLKITKLREDARDERVKAEKDARQKEKDEADNDRVKAKAIAEQKSKDEIEQIEKATDALFDALQQRNEQEQKFNDDKLAQIDKNIELQQERAIAGLSNTLDFENKERAKALEEKNRIEKRAQKQKEIQQLVEIFLEFTKVYASEKPASAAAAKALAATLVAKGISKAFAAEGGMGEDIKDKTTVTGSRLSKSHGTGKDMEVIMSTKEGILTEDEIANLGGSKGFYMLKDLLANPIKDDFLEHQEQSFAKVIPVYHKGTDDKMINVLSEKIDTLTDVIRNKKELTVYRNVIGELVIDEKQNSIRTSTTVKDNRIKNQHPLG